MNQRNRGLLYALSTEDGNEAATTAVTEQPQSDATAGEDTEGKNTATPQFDPDDQNPEDIAIDHNHPETIEGLSLVEYAELFRNNSDGILEGNGTGEAVLATENFSDHWQNFKNRFEARMSNEEAYIDTMMARLKEKLPLVQAATDKPASNVPISIFANVNWYQVDNRTLTNAPAIIHELERLVEINTATETDWVPQYAKAIKGMIDILALGASDVESAFNKAFVVDATYPSNKFVALTKKPYPVKTSGGKTVAGFQTEPYPGSWIVVRYPLNDYTQKGLKRGDDYYTTHTGHKPTSKVQLKPATRDEMKKILELSIKLCEIMDRAVDASFNAGVKMLVDKINSFENHHRNWRSYPKEEREKIASILSTGDNVAMRSWVTADVIDGTRMAVRAFERFVDMSLQRLK